MLVFFIPPVALVVSYRLILYAKSETNMTASVLKQNPNTKDYAKADHSLVTIPAKEMRHNFRGKPESVGLSTEIVVVEVLFYVHRNRRFIRDGEPRASTSTFTRPAQRPS